MQVNSQKRGCHFFVGVLGFVLSILLPSVSIITEVKQTR